MRNLGNIKILTGASLLVVLADDTQLTIDSEHISLNGIVLDNATSMDGQFTIGAAVTGQLTITVLNEDGLYSPYNFRDATCQLTFYGVAEIPDDEEEEIQEDSLLIGSYNIVDYTYDGANITLTAYDNLSLFDFPCTETRGETIAFPISLTALVQTAARICGVTLASQSAPIPNGSYTVAQQPEEWDSMTWHDVISYCAQLGGVYAKVDQYGRVYFDWYSINALPQGYDGGTFDTTDTPYSDGDTLNGGDFSYDGSEDSADGGTFTYPANMHIIGSPYSLTIDTDDVAITGLKVVLATADNINADDNTQDYTTALYGTDGYVITISGNPFIQTTAQADAIKNFLGAVVTGLWFRPLNATIDDDLSIEAGDQAYITGVDGNTYQCFISHVTYTTYAATTIACDAEPNKSSEKTRFTAADKLASHVSGIQKRLEGVSRIAGNTNQYFWQNEAGTDTGAHVTEIPQGEWSDPNSQNYHSGGNLLIRSNGIAVRDGMTELATFGADGATIGQEGDFQAKIGSGEMNFKLADGSDGFKMTMSNNYLKRMKSFGKLFTASVSSVDFEAPITSTPISFSATNATLLGRDYDIDVTDSMFPINTTRNINSYVQVERTGSTTFTATRILPVPSNTNGIVFDWWYTEEAYVPKLNFSGANNLLWSGSGSYMTSGQTITLSEPVSKQLNGIVLAWSEYTNGHARDYEWSFQYIPKDCVLRDIGTGLGVSSVQFMISMANNVAAAKTVYVFDDHIAGYESNSSTSMSVASIALSNNRWVLRYVFGV